MKRTRRKNGLAGLMLSPAVMAMRVPLLMAEAGARSTSQRETRRAISEKQAALVEGMMAAQASLAASTLSFWPEFLTGKLPSLVSGAAVEQSLEAALAPSDKRVRANYRRLSRR